MLIMILPDKEYLRIEEVAASLRNESGMPVRDIDIFDYIKQGILPAYIFLKKKYYLVPNSELTAFDEYMRDGSVGLIRFHKCSFLPPTPSIFDETVNADVSINYQYIYVKQKDLKEFEENARNKKTASSYIDKNSETLPEKDLGATERRKLLLIIAALVDLAGSYNDPVNTIASDITQKIKMSQTTVVKHLRAAFVARKNEER